MSWISRVVWEAREWERMWLLKISEVDLHAVNNGSAALKISYIQDKGGVINVGRFSKSAEDSDTRQKSARE